MNALDQFNQQAVGILTSGTARPVHYQDIIATLTDITGPPHHLVSVGQVISEVV